MTETTTQPVGVALEAAEDPTEVSLPGWHRDADGTVQPGATAYLRDPRVMTVRQKRPMQIVVSQIGSSRFNEIVTAQALLPPPTAELTAMQWQEAIEAAEQAMMVLQLSEAEWALLFRLTDASLLATLQSWNLTTADGVPVPLPANIDAVADIDGVVYDVLAILTSRLQADYMLRHGFGLDSIEEPDSPTGASVESETPSTEATLPDQPADPEPTSGASTATGE